MLTTVQFRCRTDNIGVLLHDDATGATAAIDAPDAERIAHELRARGWRLDTIATTHAHEDHIAGHRALKAAFGCTIVGAEADAGAIPGIDRTVTEGSSVIMAGCAATVLAIPGHTPGHIAYWLQGEGIVFVGDTLFVMGCGRVPDESHAAMWRSLDRLRNLPPDTSVYCGHEYAAANARFALTVDANNPDLIRRAADAATGTASEGLMPATTIGLELRTNPFLRVEEPAIRHQVGLTSASPAAVFTELRRRKDRF